MKKLAWRQDPSWAAYFTVLFVAALVHLPLILGRGLMGLELRLLASKGNLSSVWTDYTLTIAATKILFFSALFLRASQYCFAYRYSVTYVS